MLVKIKRTFSFQGKIHTAYSESDFKEEDYERLLALDLVEEVEEPEPKPKKRSKKTSGDDNDEG